ncbi:helix-turn-helix transcriptional regulator [Natronosalvus caseinilyticus]|uniref:helix-turn-helix transcriptional regulator n=1 Tax=Natronosalvus caseinilyticus TaxID=2953747 RepID=UPI0028B037AB|nr:hypothetical protein [Natronosalvus caseinilyticus]
MRFPRASVVALTVLLVAAVSVGVVAATPPADHSAHGPSSLEQSPLVLQDDDSDDDGDGGQLQPADPQQVIKINVTDSGDARWTIESRFLLEDAEDEEAFQSYAASVANGERDAGYDASTYERYVAAASEATGREMALVDAGYDEPRIEEVNRSGPMGEQSTDRVGVVAYSFTWESFATTEGSKIHVGDAFETPDGDGSWFPALNTDQQLVVAIPSNYGFQSFPDDFSRRDDGALVWDGPVEFVEDGDDKREFVLLRGESSDDGTGGTDGPGGETPPPEDPESWASTGVLLGGAALALLTVAVVGGYLVTQRSSSGSGSGSSSVPAWLPAPVRDRLEDDEPSTQDPTTPPVAAPSDDPLEEPDDGGGIDPDLLSDEERVLRLLRGNGGRMKQASIVKETGWSNAKVSQLLSKMDDDDEIEKLRIGRENLITLPEIDPTELD